MHWLEAALQELSAGNPIRLRGSGHSMTGRINDGDVVTIAPLTSIAEVGVDDVVFVEICPGRYLVHMVKQIEGDRYLIANARGEIDGWVGADAVVGKVVRIGGDPGFVGRSLDDRDGPP